MRKPGPRGVAGTDPRWQPPWDEHASFMDRLFDRGLVVLGGPVADHSGAVLVCKAQDAGDVRSAVMPDPWVTNDTLDVGDIRGWTLFFDAR